MSTGTKAPESRAVLTPRRIGALVLAALALLLVLQNRDPVSLQVFALELTAPLWVAFMATLAVGVLVGWLASGRRKAR
jgi:uncharacterized integral membrane protein